MKRQRTLPAFAIASFLVASAGLILAPSRATGQTSAIRVFDIRPAGRLDACTGGDERRTGAWRTMFETRAFDADSARVVLAALHDSLAREAATRPDDVELHYVLAAVIGSRTHVEGGRTKVRLAGELYERAGHVLALDPEHAGAHHLLGRLHAAVLRMDGFTRFIATRVLGGSGLAGASWDEARSLLEIAVVKDPCMPDHHYELARLYAEQGSAGPALDRLRDLMVLTAPEGLFADVFRKGKELLADLEAER